MAIAIVEDERVTFARGFGVEALGKPDPVDTDTIFPTGSTGKAVGARNSLSSAADALPTTGE
jgi:CubicO group peptidase (beta-lactamase class C family)